MALNEMAKKIVDAKKALDAGTIGYADFRLVVAPIWDNATNMHCAAFLERLVNRALFP